MIDKKTCDHDMPPEWAQFTKLGDKVNCPDCDIPCTIECDEFWDEETNDEYSWFFLAPL